MSLEWPPAQRTYEAKPTQLSNAHLRRSPWQKRWPSLTKMGKLYWMALGVNRFQRPPCMMWSSAQRFRWHELMDLHGFLKYAIPGEKNLTWKMKGLHTIQTLTWRWTVLTVAVMTDAWQSTALGRSSESILWRHSKHQLQQLLCGNGSLTAVAEERHWSRKRGIQTWCNCQISKITISLPVVIVLHQLATPTIDPRWM